MTAIIRANRPEISRQFPVLGFTIRTGMMPSWVEIAIATDPTLFLGADAKSRRTSTNFYSSRASGLLPAEKGELVYLVPPSVLRRFTGQTKIYYAIAVYSQGSFQNPQVAQIPPEAMPYVQVSKSFTGSRRSLMDIPNGVGNLTGHRSGYVDAEEVSLEWGGDTAMPGEMTVMPPSTPVTNGNGTTNVTGNGNSNSIGNGPMASPPATEAPETTMQGFAFAYDDGFGVFPEMQSMPKEALSTEDEVKGIEGPIPDAAPATTAQGLAFGRALNITPEYPQASRFEAAHASNFRASRSPRTIDQIVIHITDGGSNIAGPISWFKNPDADVSAHYIVGQDGEVVQMVKHNDVAWHARSANSHSIGIEHVANTRGLNPTEAQYCASAALVHWLCQQFGIPMDRTHILGHSEADQRTTHRGCPNAVWNWDYYMGMVTSGTCYPLAAAVSAGLSRSQVSIPLSTDIPLDPGTGGQSIDLSALEIGDIILSTTDAFISNVIRRATSSPVSHAMLYIGDGQVVEAIGSGVELRSLATAITEATLAVAFRVDELTDEQALRVRDFAMGQIGRSYSYWGIFKQGLFQLDRSAYCSGKTGPEYDRCIRWYGRVNLGTGSSDTFFCSQLVLAAYEHVGLPLTSTPPHWNSPDDLAELRLSGRFGYVGHLKTPIPSSSQGLSFNNRHRQPYQQTTYRQATAFASEILYDVPLIPQPDKLSCWAGAMAMLVSYRRQASIAPETLAQEVGRSLRTSYSWDMLEAVKDHFGFRDITLPSNATLAPPPEQWFQWLSNHGPLWVTVRGAPSHAIIVRGISGDLTPQGTTMYVLNPWDTRTRFSSDPIDFNPRNSGYAYTQQFAAFAADFGLINLPVGNWRVLYLPAAAQSGAMSWRAAAAQSTQLYTRSLGGPLLAADGIERMRQEFVSNGAAGANRRNCITITNAGLRQLYGRALQHADGSNRALGSTIQDTMAALQGYGLALPEIIFEFLDSSGRQTRGVVRPDRLETSVESTILNLADSNQMSGWYVFGLSVMDGYHSVLLPVAFSGLGNAATRVYWADQIYGGWDDVTGQLDTRLTQQTQAWWDPLEQNRKARTRVTIWQLLPASMATTQGLSTAVSPTETLPGDDTEGIEGYEEEIYGGSQALNQTCSDEFCPVAAAPTASSANFSLSEFTSRDGVEVPERFRGNVQRLMDNLEILRSELGDRSIRITSGYRSCAHNTRVDGAARSRHLCGQAADIQVTDVDPVTVHSTIERLIRAGRMQQGGLGLYDRFVHYDIRGRRARWDNRRGTASASAYSLADPGAITPDYGQANSTADAIRMFFDWLQRGLRFRLGVPSTTFFPHSAIAKLYGVDANGQRVLQGTGFYVGRNKLITAAHVLWMPPNGPRVEGVEVVPGLNSTNQPFGGGSVGRSGLTIHPSYNAANYNPNSDIAVITGAPDAPHGQFFDMEELRMSPDTGIITCGYAAVGVDPTRQHLDVDTIREMHNGTFTYAAQVRQGSSGGPVFYALDANTVRVVGLNVTTYDDHQNRGLRLTDSLIEWITSI